MDRKFFLNCGKKLIETAISVKVWSLMVLIYLPTWLLLNDYISDGNFTTIIVSGVTVIIVSREGFKMSRVNNSEKICSKCEKELDEPSEVEKMMV